MTHGAWRFTGTAAALPIRTRTGGWASAFLFLSRVPWMGGGLVHLLLGGPTIARRDAVTFFALHVFVIPGTLLFLALVHV